MFRFLTTAVLFLVAGAPLAAAQVEVRIAGDKGTTSVDDVGHTRFIRGQRLRVHSEEIVDGDILALVNTAHIRGHILGDSAIGTSYLDYDGEIDGDLLVGTFSGRVLGTVGEDLRALVGEAEFGGEIMRDVLVSGATVRFVTGSRVRGATLITAGQLVLDGQFDGPVRIDGSGSVELNGTFGGDVTITCDELRLGENVSIAGNLSFASRNDVTVPDDAVAGVVKPVRRLPRGGELASVWRFPTLPLWAKVLASAYFALITLLTGTLLVLFMRPFVEGALDFVEPPSALVSGFGVGLVTMLVGLVLATFCLVTLLVPLSLALWSTLGALLYFGSVVGKMIAGQALLRPLLGRAPHPVLGLLVGIIVVGLLLLIPYVGPIVWTAVTLTGVGAIMLQLRGGRSSVAAPAGAKGATSSAPNTSPSSPPGSPPPPPSAVAGTSSGS